MQKLFYATFFLQLLGKVYLFPRQPFFKKKNVDKPKQLDGIIPQCGIFYYYWNKILKRRWVGQRRNSAQVDKSEWRHDFCLRLE